MDASLVPAVNGGQFRPMAGSGAGRQLLISARSFVGQVQKLPQPTRAAVSDALPCCLRKGLTGMPACAEIMGPSGAVPEASLVAHSGDS